LYNFNGSLEEQECSKKESFSFSSSSKAHEHPVVDKDGQSLNLLGKCFLYHVAQNF